MCISILLSACGGIPVPMVDPDPFSDSLLEYLTLPSVDRDRVHRWLGPPDASRQLQQFDVYVRAREKSREIVMNIADVDLHALLIEYDDRGQVKERQEFVLRGLDGECSAQGVCVQSLYFAGAGHLYGWSAAEAQAAAADTLVLYRTPSDSAPSAPQADRCALITYYAPGTQSGYLNLRVQRTGDDQAYLLPPGSVLRWDVEPGPQSLHYVLGTVEDATGTAVDVDCPAGTLWAGRVRISKDPDSSLLRPRSSVEIEPQTEQVSRTETRSLKQILK